MQLLEPYLQNGWNALLVILGLGLIVFLHELGHFLLAKKNGVRVEAFSLGFGPVLWKRRHGETEYRLSIFPLGGYVKMAGESLVDDRRGEPWELTSKTPWQRFQIFVAGATMNLLIAFPIAIAAYAVGKVEPTNIVGQPGYAEAVAGLRPGDQVTKVGGRKIDSLEKMLPEMIRRPNGSVVPVVVKRVENGVEVERTFDVRAHSSPYHQSPMPTATTMVRDLPPGSAAYAAGLRDNDLIVSVGDERVISGHRVLESLREKPDQDVVLRSRRWKADWTTEEVATTPLRIPARTVWRIPSDEHLFEALVGKVHNGHGAWGKLLPGDRVTHVKGQPVRSWKDMKRVVESAPAEEIEVRVRRGGAEQAVKLVTGVNSEGKGVLGIAPGVSSVVAHVEPGSYYDRAGLKAGDLLWAIGLKGGENLPIPREGFGEDKTGAEAPAPVTVKVKRGAEIVDVALGYVKTTEGDLAAVGLTGPHGVSLGEAQLARDRTFGEAVSAGMREPVDVTVWTFDILRKLVTLEESSKGLSGPIGIFHVTFKSVERSFGNYLWLLCLITVNLGIFNLLPIPVLDGGHNVLLLIEVVRKWFGKPPPSEKFVATFQYSGLLLILSLFVMVTFNDLSRLWGG